jgi:hypothetical protein
MGLVWIAPGMIVHQFWVVVLQTKNKAQDTIDKYAPMLQYSNKVILFSSKDGFPGSNSNKYLAYCGGDEQVLLLVHHEGWLVHCDCPSAAHFTTSTELPII